MSGLIQILFRIIIIFIVTTLFEFTKAVASTLMGDTTPKARGRLTLNPLKHFEPIGFLLFLFTGVGWGQPVETSMTGYKSKRQGTLVTYLSPIILSLVLAWVIRMVPVFVSLEGYAFGYVYLFLMLLHQHLVMIAVFNLIPVYPLCGDRLIRCFLSPNAQVRFSQNVRLYQTIFVFLWLLGLVPQVVGIVAEGIMRFI